MWPHFNKILFSSSMLLLLLTQVLSYPVFGTKRYGRSSGALPQVHREANYANVPIHSSTLNHFLPPPNYYIPPYAPNYEVDYGQDPSAYSSYNPMSAPLYYSSNTNDNLGYGLYPSLVPAYFDTRRSAYGYYDDDNLSPVDDLHEEIQDEEREERGDALPIGQETWFENGGQQQLPPQESIADVNAAFLRNLILSQMYNDVQNVETPAAYRTDQMADDWFYDESRQQQANGRYYSDADYDDDDVRELKSLAKKNVGYSTERLNRVPRQKDDSQLYGKPVLNPTDWNSNSKKRSMDYGTIVDTPMNSRTNWIPTSYAEGLDLQAPYDTVAGESSIEGVEEEVSTIATTTATSPKPTTTAPDFDSRRGQKEVPLLRPASARHLSAEQNIERFLQTRSAGEKTEKETPSESVYDTIKHLLSMEHGLHQDSEDVIREQPHKRFVSNEESLVDQLGGLKKLSS